MITADGVSLSFGQRVLFQDVNIQFQKGNCYGLIGANGAGKSTFLKILSGQIEPDHGSISVQPGARVATLKQNQFEFDEVDVLKTVLMGNRLLFDVMEEKDALYAKPDFGEADGIRASELETQFADLNGWEAESQAGELLEAIGVSVEFHATKMGELEAGQKIRVLLAQALFGNPDVLLLDEPTNNLDLETIDWLEEFLINFDNTVIVVSHDRHFLDKVCTHIADVDRDQITSYTGNYAFWYQATQLALQQRSDRNKKNEDKAKELKSFIERFSANAAKSKQATARKKMLEKLSIEEFKPSSRRYPHIVFEQQREAGKDLLQVDGLAGSLETEKLFSHLDLTVTKGEKLAFVGRETHPASLLFKVLSGDLKAHAGEFRWGITTSVGYFPKDHESFFEDKSLNLIEWLRQYATTNEEREEEYLRGFLGKMLFSAKEVYKSCSVLSGGEKVRCMFSKIMMQQPNVLLLEEPTAHLDLESITSLNNSLMSYPGTILFISQDRAFIDSIATRIVEITPKGMVDKQISYQEFMERADISAERSKLY